MQAYQLLQQGQKQIETEFFVVTLLKSPSSRGHTDKDLYLGVSTSASGQAVVGLQRWKLAQTNLLSVYLKKLSPMGLNSAKWIHGNPRVQKSEPSYLHPSVFNSPPSILKCGPQPKSIKIGTFQVSGSRYLLRES